MPPSVASAIPAASISSMLSATGRASAPLAAKASGSNPRRSVKRQCSSEVDGSGSASYRSSAALPSHEARTCGGA